jgi:CheY-like chemotaxis protein
MRHKHLPERAACATLKAQRLPIANLVLAFLTSGSGKSYSSANRIGEMSQQKSLVLIVEDNHLVRLAVEEVVSEGGFAFVAVATGDAAVVELEGDIARFCAVLTDVQMPGMASGWEVGRRARQLRADIPVIYMTADSAYHWTANGVPNSVLLQKPFAPAQLIAALETLLN